MLDITKCIKWNEDFGNKRFVVNKKLEEKLLTEEFMETIKAITERSPTRKTSLGDTVVNIEDAVEIADGIIDMIFVGIGTLHKIPYDKERRWQNHEVS